MSHKDIFIKTFRGIWPMPLALLILRIAMAVMIEITPHTNDLSNLVELVARVAALILIISGGFWWTYNDDIDQIKETLKRIEMGKVQERQ